jgi:hypothetical protein
MGLPSILWAVCLSLVQLLADGWYSRIRLIKEKNQLILEYDQMISEVTPRGKEFLFFSLFSIIGKTSSFIGPLVSQAIINAALPAQNAPSQPFYFLFSLSLVSFLFLIFFVDVKKSRIEQAEFLERERIAKEKIAGGSSEESDMTK